MGGEQYQLEILSFLHHHLLLLCSRAVLHPAQVPDQHSQVLSLIPPLDPMHFPLPFYPHQPCSSNPRFSSIYFPSPPLLPPHKLFPMNFRFAKLNHHLLGRSAWPPVPSSNTRASNRDASSCRTCIRYWRSVSASWRDSGGLNICAGGQSANGAGFARKRRGGRTWLSGNPGSPGMEKLLSRAMFWTSFWASLCKQVISAWRTRGMKAVVLAPVRYHSCKDGQTKQRTSRSSAA